MGAAADAGLAEPALAPSPREPEEAEPARSIGVRVGAATLLFLEIETCQPPEESKWRYERQGIQGSQVLELDSSGRCSVPAGRIEILPADSGHSAVDPDLDLRPGDSSTVWIRRPVGRKVLVLDLDGLPIENAHVRWRSKSSWDPLLAESPFWEDEPERSAVTDAAGRARLDELDSSVGELFVMREGYASTSLSLSHPAHDAGEVVVHLRPVDSVPSRLRFLAADDLRPLAGIELVSRSGIVPGRSEGSGSFRSPYPFASGEELVVRGQGICTSAFNVEDGSTDVHVLRASRLRILVVAATGSAGAGHLMLRALAPPPATAARPCLPELVPLDDLGRAEVAVPLGLPTRLRALAPDGRSAVADIVPFDPDEAVTLRLDTGSPLELRARSSSGAPVAGLLVIVRYDSRHEVELTPTEAGSVAIPAPEEVLRIYVRAPGHAPAYLLPRDGYAGGRSGSMQLTLSATHDVKLRLEDEAGTPLSGYAVSLQDLRQKQAYRIHPELFGAWPTDHPGWIELTLPPIPRGRSPTTDGEGRITLTGVSAGEYRAEFDVHPMLQAAETGSLGLETPFDVVVPSLEEQVCRMPARRRVAIAATERTTGQPTESLWIRDIDGMPGPPERVPGNHWEGWVQTGHRLEVSAEGLEPERVVVTAAPDLLRHEVVLFPSEPAHIVFTGDVAELLGTPVRVVVREATGGSRATVQQVFSDGSIFNTVAEERDLSIDRTSVEIVDHTTGAVLQSLRNSFPLLSLLIVRN
jgi:hypothetical protein